MKTAWPAHFRIDRIIQLGTGLFLLVCGSLYAIAALLMAPSQATLEALRSLTVIPPQAVERLIDDQGRALEVLQSGAGLSNLGLALATKAESSAGGERAELLSRSEKTLRASLSLAPANPYAWLRLALVEQAEGKDAQEIVTAWRFSRETGPNENLLWIPRISLAVAYWPSLSNDDRWSVLSDVRHAWHLDSEQVLDLARDNFTANVVRAALVIDLPEFFQFEKALRERR
jgi:hypothetical protein